jgi:pyruvate/2-oxoglutarate dehydrogenase complex dihydrolipoamide acyltransferase (E2) component
MRPRSIVIPIAGALTVGVILASAQASPSSTSARTTGTVCADQVRDRDDDTRTVAARAAAEHGDEPKPIASPASSRLTADHRFTLSGECQSRIGALRTLVQGDRAEDEAEAANPPADDTSEDLAERAALKTAIQAAITACLPARISACAAAVNSLNTTWLREAMELHLSGSQLDGAALQLRDRMISSNLTAARQAVLSACVTSR